MPGILVIIPTYNEQENIINLINKLNFLKLDLDILIVDDGSDKTADLVRQNQERLPNLFLIKRQGKSGRGSAVIEGFKYGLQKDYQYFVEMDADFSHEPDELPGLLKLAESNGIVIGSRYVKGSKIINWPMRRRIFSKLANIYANLILKIGIKDYTNGYRVYQRAAIAKLELDKIKAVGYIALSEIAYQLFKKDIKIIENKSIFINRKRGSSNFSLKEIKESFLAVLRIKKEVK
ncbi:MAG: polyprenol monophosphomannose synthase [Candidatus Falkowbacteria bacterium]